MLVASQVCLSRMFDSLLVCISGFHNLLSIVFLSTDSMEIPEQFIDVADGMLGKNKSFLLFGLKSMFAGPHISSVTGHGKTAHFATYFFAPPILCY